MGQLQTTLETIVCKNETPSGFQAMLWKSLEKLFLLYNALFFCFQVNKKCKRFVS